jgi:hypothetical protein
MSSIMRVRLADNLTWSGLDVWIGIVKGGNVAEVEIEYNYHSAANLRDMATALNEAADTLDPSNTLDRELLESIRYLQDLKTKIAMTIDDLPVQVVTQDITQALISLAKAMREKDGQS